ncbi:putative toxin-antitoxin system toxin component, PIN family [Candidatus Curtissbacteria bacterium RIFCSPHIGHO2_02_FULL_40_17]|uniref:Putative toxin-antitoxin system toxin component, PIN family n=4 Tax=Candidatus Curtissiibacteriota TaxID=1752717 RepID=A0A1F5GGV4_9BACT|nr:MAG: putative toxin-antitoxin system toxin component, PIN family [Candidatus Curtissbacteria bacterium RIFCSPHIGHO2_01_FULL_40_12]OGD91090.1 MAG: putative toxin-antitoxin system toxin component, PIN family [Candidatus Curtissbacteria bacterium RIFCSPHIGHO2_02_FULL_40_17]OGE05502.1 MAG: putative toxin-antitoxin system toxin component, PIN family [Candidatus Curtissbacteria bacterium RIFCSPHIGHO2_12_FULL_41_17]OGE07096.1 MAG: putative toxin-antitoxin system toxin component, PIN family [Candidat
MRVILDANIIIGFLLTKGYIISSIFDYWENNRFTLLISNDILDEYRFILDRLIELKMIDKYKANTLLRIINKKAVKINVASKFNASPDRKDNRYLECGKDGKANYLVTRDKGDLLFMKNFKYTKIISASELLEILKGLDYTG